MIEARLRILVSGHVHGVFFRGSTEAQATRLGLFGWVRNLTDGRVEIVVEGDQSNLERLVEWCQRGPPGSRVEGVDVEWSEPTGEFDRFWIARTR